MKSSMKIFLYIFSIKHVTVSNLSQLTASSVNINVSWIWNIWIGNEKSVYPHCSRFQISTSHADTNKVLPSPQRYCMGNIIRRALGRAINFQFRLPYSFESALCPHLSQTENVTKNEFIPQCGSSDRMLNYQWTYVIYMHCQIATWILRTWQKFKYFAIGASLFSSIQTIAEKFNEFLVIFLLQLYHTYS